MLQATCGLLADVAGPETVLVAHNLLGFNLPRLRLATIHNGIALPAQLQVGIMQDDARQTVFAAFWYPLAG